MRIYFSMRITMSVTKLLWLGYDVLYYNNDFYLNLMLYNFSNVTQNTLRCFCACSTLLCFVSVMDRVRMDTQRIFCVGLAS